MWRPREITRTWGRWYDPVGDMDWNTRDTEAPRELDVDTECFKEDVERITKESLRNFFALCWTRIDEREVQALKDLKDLARLEYLTLIQKYRLNEVSAENVFEETKKIKASVSRKLWPNRDPLFLEMG